MSLFKNTIKRFRKNNEGAILTELALSLPFFIGMLMGLVEVGNFLLLHLKLQHAVVSVSDLATRDEEISEDVVTDIFQAVPQILAPFTTADKSTVYITAISQSAEVPASIYWQRAGAGTLAQSSDLGSEGDAITTLPAGLTLRDDETILATEIFYSYEPLIFNFLDSYTIRKASYFRPRIGSLQQINP